MADNIWKKVRVDESSQIIYDEVDQFFENIHGSKELEYREGQHTMALDIVDTIRDKQILLIEAQVGIGKSYAYLIPLLTAVKNDEKFHGFIVATSTIALQEQLLKDINKVAEMLEMDHIDVSLAKGKNNYLCISRLHQLLKNPAYKDYIEIFEKIQNENLVDRKDLEQIPEDVWNKINVKNCKVYSCPYYGKCKFVVKKENYSASKKIIITNQDLLAQHLKAGEDSKIFSNTDMIVIDEAHNFEEKLRTAYVETVDKRKIEGTIYQFYQSVCPDMEALSPSEEIFNSLNDFFIKIRSSAKRFISKLEAGTPVYSNYERVQFVCSKNLLSSINTLEKAIKKAIKEVSYYNSKDEVDSMNRKSLNTLKSFLEILNDLKEEHHSKNIYWIDFLDREGKYIQLMYAPRNMKDISSGILERSKSGFVLTSATLSANDNYNYFSESIGLNQVNGKSVLKEFPITSPYDYKENTILYCPTDIEKPTGNRSLYLDQLTERIKELMDITKGRSLILFTSKKDMQYVYDKVLTYFPDYPIFCQQDGANIQKLKQKFEQNIHSCLFATGTFYEGIDIKGESLSSVIITRLPFPVVDPVVEEKANEYRDGFEKVYLPEMLLKLKQGTGRLIRSSEDKGIVSILDSRFLDYDEKYEYLLTKSLPFENITSDLEEVKHFASSKLR